MRESLSWYIRNKTTSSSSSKANVLVKLYLLHILGESRSRRNAYRLGSLKGIDDTRFSYIGITDDPYCDRLSSST